MEKAISLEMPPVAAVEETVDRNALRRSAIAFTVLLAALLLGLLGDGLLRQVPWGLNVPLWVGAVVGTVFALLKLQRIPTEGDGRWLWLAALFFAAGIAWRSSPTLIGLCLLATAVALALAAHYTVRGRSRRAGLLDYVAVNLLSTFHAAFGTLPLVFSEVKWGKLPRNQFTRVALPLLRGLLIAVPLLILFGTLFMAADAVFQGLVTDLLDIDLSKLISHLILIGFFTWISVGFLRYVVIERYLAANRAEPSTVTSPVQLGPIEVGVVLGLLNLLFIAFVLVQFRYFFGGAALIEASVTLSYAEYARRGFFELVTVAALVLPLLLAMHWIARADTATERRLFRGLAALLIALLFVIMLSAIQRMRLYQAEFGLTELRFYTSVFMGWLAVLFIWFVATVLRGQRNRFIFGALVTGFLTIGLLLSINPDALIVRTNVARALSPTVERSFDGRYLGSLSDDAIPTLLELWPDLTPAQQCDVVLALDDRSFPARTEADAPSDWRSWNWSRARAASLLQQEAFGTSCR